ncbi:LVIVD repeat-containing protein [Nocardioides jiangxiensis]|uniref:LVIVD repeat-containing protein n=1 Tax=Nocardioides jiangxiensis TaxID=3064524 RepID=A0ABT9B3V3_9ACTN|nr:hypothetical protein [Nocardioides sp. WY-20]MDO7869526.1 hypothetical protein [Nocardioides sp. WY-20]
MDHRNAVHRLIAALVVALGLGTLAIAGVSQGAADTWPAATPRAVCGPGSLPETSWQGRVPKADYDSGRAAKGYFCNTRQVAHQGASGGFKVERYTDPAGHTCAFYDSTLIAGRDVLSNTLNGTGLGVQVLDMADPAAPVKTASLVTPAMLSPHETLLVNRARGLLVAVMGTAATLPGVMDVYDVRTDCRHPRLLSTSPMGILGHESGFAPDGRTFWSAGIAGTLAAIDLTDPRTPKLLKLQTGVVYHGVRLSPDGRTMYVANIGSPSATGISGGGLRILDVSQVQDRVANPQITTLSSLTWRELSIPQVAEPFTKDGRTYVMEVDEFIDLFSLQGLTSMKTAPVGAARIIDVTDPVHPRIISNLRLEAQQPDRRDAEWGDPGASFPAQGYAAHYCSIPRTDAPKLVGCSMILSGLRLFDISDLAHPKEAAYFNRPLTSAKGLVLLPPAIGSWAMSAPAYDAARGQVWYTDANSGFYVVQLTNGTARLLT